MKRRAGQWLVASPGQPTFKTCPVRQERTVMTYPAVPCSYSERRTDLFWRGLRRRRGDLRRGGLRHRDVGLPGDADRPELPPAGGGRHGAAHRQHRLERRGRRVRPDLGRRLRRPRCRPDPLQLAVAPQPGRRARGPGRGRDAATSTPARSPGTSASGARCGSACPASRPTRRRCWSGSRAARRCRAPTWPTR